MAHAAFANLIADLAAESKTIFASSTSQIKADKSASSSSSSSSRPDDFLALQSALLLCYNAHLTTLASHRALGLSLSDSNGTEMVQNLVRMRLQLEKMKPIEARLRPKWMRWIRAAAAAAQQAEDDDDEEEVNFRPNPSALLDTAPAAAPSSSSDKKAARSSSSSSSSGTYRPPKLAPVPYNPREIDSRNEKAERRDRSINAHLLSDLSTSLSSNPYSEASSGLATGSSGSASTSVRARKLAEMEAYEEDNFTRLAQSKKDARKRRRDEEDVALGGATTAGTGKGKVGAGLEEEFGDLLRGSGRKRGRGELDELKMRSKAARGAGATPGLSEGGKSSRRGGGGGGPGGNRFEKAVKSHQRRK